MPWLLLMSAMALRQVLVAAGNDGPSFATVGDPATAKNNLAIGAGENAREAYNEYDGTTYGDEQMKRAQNLVFFSSRGPTADGRFKPDVVCPGDDIRSACSDGSLATNQCGSQVESYYDNKDRPEGVVLGMSGTSMATPLCAGAAALVRQYFRCALTARDRSMPLYRSMPLSMLLRPMHIALCAC